MTETGLKLMLLESVCLSVSVCVCADNVFHGRTNVECRLWWLEDSIDAQPCLCRVVCRSVPPYQTPKRKHAVFTVPTGSQQGLIKRQSCDPNTARLQNILLPQRYVNLRFSTYSVLVSGVVGKAMSG